MPGETAMTIRGPPVRPSIDLPSTQQVTVEDGDLLSPLSSPLTVKPLDGDFTASCKSNEDPNPIYERIGIVPSKTGAVVSVQELKANWEIPPPPDCAPPPPPFSNSPSGPTSWDPPPAPHDLSSLPSPPPLPPLPSTSSFSTQTEKTAFKSSVVASSVQKNTHADAAAQKSSNSNAKNNTSATSHDVDKSSANSAHPAGVVIEDGDLMFKMGRSHSLVGGDEGLGEDEEILEEDFEEDEEDDASFTVHFAHHGRKESDADTSKMDLLAQISELQEAVSTMKTSLTEAVTRLAAVTEEGGSNGSLTAAQQQLQQQQMQWQEDLQQTRSKCDGNTTQVVKLVLSLKGDVNTLKKEVSAVSERQDALQKSLDALLEERQREPHTRRSRHYSGGRSASGGDNGGGRSSGAQSSDSGVALLLERAHHAFLTDALTASPSASLLHRTSDQDSLPEQPSLLVPPLVYDYVAGLNAHPGPPHNSSGSAETEDLAYDSDSSITMAANKSISLSANISKEMRAAGLTCSPHSSLHHTSDSHSPLNHDSPTNTGTSNQKNKSHSKNHQKFGASTTSSLDSSGGVVNRTDSDGSDQSRDVVQTGRRRRYEKGMGSSSSTGKLYAPIHRSHSQDSTTYAALSCCGPLSAAGLYNLNNHDLYSHANNHHHHHHHHQQQQQQQQYQRDVKDSHRCRVARELLETEKKYCRTLWIIQDTFAEPLKKCGILTQADISTLFPIEVYQLYDKHCHLQHQLRERLASWQWQPLVGDILAKFTEPHQSDVLRLYTSYVNDFPEVLKTFNKLCRKSPPFTKFIKACLEQPSCGGLDLGAFLLTPVQRIPRYILLLKQLLKYTDETHPDFHHINVCLERLKDFLDRLNESIEHSFQLVHATFAGGIMEQPVASPARTGRSRATRSPRRSRSTAEESPPSYSPERLTSRSADRGPHEGTEVCSPTSKPSPKRSSSMAGGGPAKQLVVSKRRPQSSEAGRSRSLPRAVPLSPTDEGTPVKEKKSKRPARPLPTARSVADMTTTTEEERSMWDELAASEPSLLDQCGKPDAGDAKEDLQESNAMSGSPGNSSAASGDRLPNWQDASPQEDGVVKKKSIKTSLKNMFTFKRRTGASPSGARPSSFPNQHHHTHVYHPHDHHHHLHHHHHNHKSHHHPARPVTARGMREESDYWDPQTQAVQDVGSSPNTAPVSQQPSAPQLKQSRDASHQLREASQQLDASPQQPTQVITPPTFSQSNGHYQSLASLQNPPPPQTPAHTPHPPSTPVPGQHCLSVVGDFVDEDGNPCSNV